MTFKKTVITCVAICIMAILWVALCGCDDLGAYEDTTEYYDAFGKVVMINGESGQVEEYEVDEYFYNEDSREDFLVDDDGNYYGIEHGKFVYIAIPFEKDIDMDSLALYMQSMDDAAIYMSFYVVDELPLNFRPIGDKLIADDETDDTQNGGTETGGTQTDGTETGGSETGDGNETGDGTSGGESGGNTENEKPKYDDPDYSASVGEIVIHLEKEKWNSFVLERFSVNGEAQESIQIKEDQYLLIQIRNNSGVREFDKDKNAFVDPQSGLELEEARITATNLLIRALDIKDGNEEQGGEQNV